MDRWPAGAEPAASRARGGARGARRRVRSGGLGPPGDRARRGGGRHRQVPAACRGPGRRPGSRARGRERASPGAGADPTVRGPGQHLRVLGSSPDARRRAVAALLATHLGDGNQSRRAATRACSSRPSTPSVTSSSRWPSTTHWWWPWTTCKGRPVQPPALGTLGGRLRHVPVVLIGCQRLLPRPPELTWSLEARRRAARAGCHSARSAGRPWPSWWKGRRRRAGPALLAGVAGAGGNPLYVTELARRAPLGGSDPGRRRLGRGPEMTLPPTLRLTILRRRSLLPQDGGGPAAPPGCPRGRRLSRRRMVSRKVGGSVISTTSARPSATWIAPS